MKWISSTEDKRWCVENMLSAEKGEELVLGKEIGKPIYGFGCCISELCVKAIMSLEEEKQNTVFDELFGQENCGFNYCRLSIGANDFAESWYSYNETEGDYAMENFSIDRDRKYIIPTVKKAQELSPEIEFFASPWSPPAWMKFPKVYNFGKIIETDENLRAYALYLKKFIEEYEKEGINIKQLHVQNEIFADQKFPSCVWEPEVLERFIGDYLAPEIGDRAEIWFGTLNGPEDWNGNQFKSRYNQFLGRVMQNEKCKKAISGASFQWAGKFAITQAKEDYPELDFVNSECECGDGENTWQYAMYTYEMMHHYFKFGARANVYWNMALDGGASTWGWKQNSLISVKEGAFTYTPEFYVVKHFSHFVKRGAVMLGTKGGFSSNATVFLNPEGERVAIVMNPFEFEKILTIENKNYVLKPRSFNTIVL